MKSIIATLALTLLALSPFATAEVMSIPKEKPAATVDVPEDWETEETDEGITCESPDNVVTMFFEITSKKEVDTLIEENVDWLTKDQKVEIDQKSQKSADFKAGQLDMKRISWDGKSEEWGEAVVGFMFAEVSSGKVLTITYWITKKDAEKHFPDLEKIFASLKKAKK